LQRPHMTTGKSVSDTPADLPGKIILLTGGGDGIGRECALAYAREGATVAILDRDLETARQTASDAGGDSVAFHADVSDGEAVRVAIGAVLARFGRMDAVHNNAGIASPSKPLHETTEQEWDDLQRVNLKSVFWTTKFAFEALAASKGSILLTASMAGVWTPMLEKWCGEQADPASIRTYLDDIHLLGPCPHGDVIADAAVFLLSYKARFITGCILPVSGGAELGYRR